jgi:hypothetical protein
MMMMMMGCDHGGGAIWRRRAVVMSRYLMVVDVILLCQGVSLIYGGIPFFPSFCLSVCLVRLGEESIYKKKS